MRSVDVVGTVGGGQSSEARPGSLLGTLMIIGGASPHAPGVVMPLVVTTSVNYVLLSRGSFLLLTLKIGCIDIPRK